ncbi:MAG: betaine/proline/choline family ABC transporter ATP-binding protein [Christensenellales bacterium]
MIRFENVSKVYRGHQQVVVDNISFTIPKGQIVVLIGPSGCGKTTSLKMINRLIRITSGKIYIDGEDNQKMDPIELRRAMGYVIQQIGLFPHLTLRENIEIIPKLQHRDKKQIAERTMELMEMVGLDVDTYIDRYPTQLSGGQLQRVGVARAFATDPQIILMDEPFSSLDPITRAQLQDELAFLQLKVKKTIVFVTHDMDEAIKIADKICILHEGKIVQYDTPEVIMKQPANDYVSAFVGKKRIWSNPEYIRARDIMRTDPVTVPLEMPAMRTMDFMRSKGVDSALVVDNQRKFVGIVRARDIQRQQDKSVTAGSIMRWPKETATPDHNIIDLLTKVKSSSVSNVPVVSEDQTLLGLITTSSLVTTLSQQYIDFEEAGLE